MALVKIQVRRDTAANWTASNPVLFAGEPGLETDTGKIKYGDGVRNWNTLPYSSGVALGSTVPPAAGTASAGTSETAARADHTHALPSALTAATIASTGNATVGGSLTVSGSLVGGSHRHFASEIENLSSEVFSQIASSIKAGANVSVGVDPVAKTITVSSTATAAIPLAISSDPADVISSGATASFTSRAVGGGGAVAYQWEQSTDTGKTWSSVPGATGITLTVSGIVAADDGKQYRLRASAGNETVFSRPATLNVADIAVVAQPADITTGVGGIVQLSVQASAGEAAITYQWQRRGSSTVSWENIPTATLATYSYSATSVNDADGDQFRVAITSLGRTVYSRTATVLIRGAALAISDHPDDVTDTAGAASFSVTATSGVPPYTYQWQRLNGGSSTWSAADDFMNIPAGTSGVSGQTSATLSLTGQDAAQHQRKYRVLVSDAEGGSATSAIATLSTLSLKITVEPSSVAALAGSGVAADAFTALATADGSVTYQWQKSTDNGATWTNVAGATNANYGSFAPAITDNGTLYRCAITGDGQTLNTRSATLSVTLPPDTGLRATSTLDAVYLPVANADFLPGKEGERVNPANATPVRPFHSSTISISFTFAGGHSTTTVSSPVSAREVWLERKRADGSWEKYAPVSRPLGGLSYGTAAASGTYVLELPAVPANSPPSGLLGGYIQSGVYRAGFISRGTATDVRSAYTTEFEVRIPTAAVLVPREAETALAGGDVTLTPALVSSTCQSTLQYQWVRFQSGTFEAALTASNSPVLALTGLTKPTTADASGGRYWQYVLYAKCGDTYIRQSLGFTYTLTVIDPPLAVSVQPADATAALGVASFSFSITGGGAGVPVIQWQRALAGGGWSDIPGATSSSLNLSGVTPSLNGSQYRASITLNGATVVTRAAVLTVPGSTITLQPRDTTAPAPDGRATVTFDFSSTCAAPLIVWEQQAANSNLWTPIPSATGKTLTLSGLTQSVSGLKVRASVRCDSVITYSAIATIAVPAFSAFVTEPSSQSVAPGGTVSLSFTSGLPVGTYKFVWQTRRGMSGQWVAWTGPTQGQAISFTASYLEHNDLRFRVALYPWNAGPILSQEATVTVGQSRSICTVDSLPGQVTGIAFAKGALVATSSLQTQIARRSTDEGVTWRNVFLPSAEYWDGIVSTTSGRMIAYTQGHESTNRPAKLACSDDGGLTWRTLATNRRLGERLQIRRLDYPAPTGALLAFYWSGLGTLVMGVSLDDGATWAQYPMPSLASVATVKSSYTAATDGCSYYNIQNVAVSDTGVLLLSTMLRVDSLAEQYGSITGGSGLLRRDVGASGWGTPTVVNPIAVSAPPYASPASYVPVPLRRR